MIRRLIELTVDHPWMTMGLIAAITLAFFVAVPQLTTQTDISTYFPETDPAIAAMNRAEARYGYQDLFLVAIAAEDTIFTTSTLGKIKAMTAEFEEILGVDEVTGPLNAELITGTEEALYVGPVASDEEVPRTPEAMEEYRQRILGSRMLRDFIVSSDGKAAAISIKLKLDIDQTKAAEEVVAIVEKYRGPEEIYIAGDPYMNLALAESMGRDLKLLLPLVFLAMIVVLFLSFRSLRGIMLPLLVVTLTAIWTLGAMALLSVPITLISFILPVILIAIGLADGIHILSRYYEEAAKGVSKRETVLNTMTEMRTPVILTSLTTAAGFLSLLSSFLIPQREFGLMTALGVMVAMVLSLALIPALLSVLPLPKRAPRLKEGLLSRTLAAFERTVARHTRIILGASVILLITFGIGTTMIRVESSPAQFLGDDHPVVQAGHVMDAHFSGTDQVSIEIDTGIRDGLKDPALLARIVALEEWLKTKPGINVNKTFSLTDLVREMNQKFHADDPRYYVIPDDRQLVGQLLLLFTFQGGSLGNMALRDFSAGVVTAVFISGSDADGQRLTLDVQDYLEQNFPDVHAEMVGETRVMATILTKLTASQITSLLTAILAAGLMVALLMRSWIAGAISLIPLVLTIVINFGVMGLSGIPLDIMTLLVSSIAIGIGIDYSIHFLTRFRLECQVENNPRDALNRTILSAGRGISYNALALALGFGILLFSSFLGLVSFGALIAMTMILSALSVFTVIPAFLITWKPKFLTLRHRGR